MGMSEGALSCTRLFFLALAFCFRRVVLGSVGAWCVSFVLRRGGGFVLFFLYFGLLLVSWC